MSGQSYNIKLIATVSVIDSTDSDVLEVEMVVCQALSQKVSTIYYLQAFCTSLIVT